MKKILGFITLLILAFCLFGCQEKNEIEIKKNEDMDYSLTSSDIDIDYTKYFTITVDGKPIEVTTEMLDLSKVDVTKEGTFTISIKYDNVELSADFTVEIENTNKITSINITNNKNLVVNETNTLGITTTPTVENAEIAWESSDNEVATVSTAGLVTAIAAGEVTITAKLVEDNAILDTVSVIITDKIEDEIDYADLKNIFDKYSDIDKINYEVKFVLKENSEPLSDIFYSYEGNDCKLEYEYEDISYVDFLIYNDETLEYEYYAYEEDKYVLYKEEDEYFYDYYDYTDYLDLSLLNNYKFIDKGTYYQAENVDGCARSVLGDYEEDVWTYFYLEIQDGFISKITASCQSTYEEGVFQYDYILTFTNNNNVQLDLSVLDIEEEDPINDDPIQTNKTSVFIDKYLNVGENQIQYETIATANSFDNTRGVQFLQRDGEITITSSVKVTALSSVTVVLSTNNDLGMKASCKVGNVNFLVNNNAIASIEKGTSTITFTNNEKVDGVISITLIPQNTAKSMYISLIRLDGSTTDPVESNYMPDQEYNSQTDNKTNLQDEVMKVDEAIGLPSTGTYSVLVVPVKFTDSVITNEDLDKLEKAFNGTSADTGWESVKTYYQKASLGLLNLSFDIVDIYNAKNNANYYNNYSKEISDESDSYTQTGEELLLLEVLAYLEPLMDLTKYDTNDDGVIDAVYLIYSEEVDYDDDNSLYWAYVTYYISLESKNETFDGLDAYYYLFAGFDFMDEDTTTGFEYNGKIDGLLINPSTFIHETGHLLALDDYYDYEERNGCNEGLGGADMMDSTVGDHSSYSKIMLGWISPTIVTTTQTIELDSFEDSGEVIMVLLDYNGTYFSEYLLIDLYTDTGLNALHASQNDSSLYDGAEYGVRIYHVSSEIDNPYEDSDYASFTKYNNTDTSIALIKLIEADGETKFKSSNGYSASSDLFQSGDSLLESNPNYKRNDGMLINFDISFANVTKDGASVTITFVE